MPVLVRNACSQAEMLREVVDCQNGDAVQIMPPPSYLEALLYEGNDRDTESGLTSDIILVYKANTKSSTSSLPLDVRDDVDVSFDSELDGNPLPAPFANDEFDVSVVEKRVCQWAKGELNHYPLRVMDTWKVLDALDDSAYDISNALDVWVLVDGGIEQNSSPLENQNSSVKENQDGSNMSMLDSDVNPTCVGLQTNEKKRILTGVHATENWWTRSYVDSQGVCSLASPQMDPLKMIKSHEEMTGASVLTTNVVVRCLFNILGECLSADFPLSGNASSVSLEVEWKQPTLTIPRQTASTRVIVQARVGHKSSPSHGLWKQLCVLNELFELLLSCWREKNPPELLPHLDRVADDSGDESLLQESLKDRIKTLVLGGSQALANRRMSVAPKAHGFLGRMSMAPQAKTESNEKDSNKFSLAEAIKNANGNHHSDLTDGLFSLLIECKTYRELMSAWDWALMELNDARRPYIRPRNSTRAAKYIQNYSSGLIDSLDIESGMLALEFLIEIGIEKLTTDYHYILSESNLGGRDLLQAPQLVRSGLSVSRERWLASCGEHLGWLAQVHCAIEVLLPLQDALSSNWFGMVGMASQTLQHYQSKNSPVRSVGGLLSPGLGNAIQEFSWNVTADAVHEHFNRNFDWWKMTVRSENDRRKIKSAFLRSHLRPIFPPQLCDCSETALPDQYYCAEAVTISEKF